MAARSAKGRAQRLSKDLTCSICLDLFKKPVSLPCDHTFCRACIAGFWSRPPRLGQDQAQDQGQNPNSNQCGVTVASCPQCREVFPSQSCRPNRIVASIVESYCQGLEEGESLGTGRAAAEAMPQCARHQEDLKLFCEDDQELVCLVCGVSQEHKSHTLVCIQEAQQRCKTTLSNSISALRTELSTALECEREIEEEVKKLKQIPPHSCFLILYLSLNFFCPSLNHFVQNPTKKLGHFFETLLRPSYHRQEDHTADLKQRIEAQFSDLHQFLYQEEKMLQVKLKTEERRELIRLDEHRAVLNVEISQLRRSLAEIEDRLKERDPYQLLKNAKALLQSRQPVKFERPPLTPPNLCEGRFAGPLQYRVWKSLKGILYPGTVT
nr:E3 ubiquitin-protein ligase TRIM17-like isoform X1 [Paramormyrops kingsleyae]